jgi:hypothetical protein
VHTDPLPAPPRPIRQHLTFWRALLALGLAGCSSLEEPYEERLRAAFAAQPLGTAPVLTEADLAHLPAPVQRYVRRSGAVGRPRVQNVRFAFDAQMYRKPGDAPLPSSSIQHNFMAKPARLFFMKSRMFGLPVRVFHAYADEAATMQVRVASLVNMVDLAGEELATGETVTVLNDLCFFAPGALVDPRLGWEPVDERTVKVTFQNGRRRVGATLHFNERDELVNFVSDDRAALLPDGSLARYRWSTPVSDYREFDGRRVATRGAAVYAYPEGDFTYGTFVLQSIAWDVPAPPPER